MTAAGGHGEISGHAVGSVHTEAGELVSAAETVVPVDGEVDQQGRTITGRMTIGDGEGAMLGNFRRATADLPGDVELLAMIWDGSKQPIRLFFHVPEENTLMLGTPGAVLNMHPNGEESPA